MSMIGKTLGTFTLEAQIGKGGMGEVYKAKDHKLGRDVAIKVLPAEFAKDADRVARFQREAKLLASLNHPNIAAIHGLEESDGTHFLILELIEGDTLADRIKSGPIPVEEALKLALQIAEALEAAHEKGVIHRDLKPANIKVTPDGKVKVLDFGLAKAFAGEQAEVNLSNSPTLSVAATQQGIILGTAAYMSPEQARGETVDKKADIWAFGVVLFEMLTGRTIFDARTVSDTLAAVLMREPEWSGLPPNLHPRIRLLLERCLKKESQNRYSGISDARVDIKEVLADPSGVLVQPVTAEEPRKKLRVGISWIAAAIVLTAIIIGVAVWYLKPSEPKQVMRFYHEPPGDQAFTNTEASLVDISADGRKIVYGANDQLYIRDINGLTARPIQGADEDPYIPIFSPDGLWIAYFSASDSQWKKITVSGGAPITLCDASYPCGATWGMDDVILFGQEAGIMRVSADGGTAERIIDAGEGNEVHGPQALPGGEWILFTMRSFSSGSWDEAQIVVQSLVTGERKTLVSGGSDARYVPTGHLVYALGDVLYAKAFDVDSLKVTGAPAAILEDVQRASDSGSANYGFSDTGTLAYVVGGVGAALRRILVWVDRDGIEEVISAKPGGYFYPRLSPDGSRVALDVRGDQNDIVVWDIIRETLTRFTPTPVTEEYPAWTPHNKRIAYMSASVPNEILWQLSDGGGTPEKIYGGTGEPDPYFFSPTGEELVFGEKGNVGMISLTEKEADPRWLLDSKFDERNAELSPNGKWMAYQSDESGQREIYVRPFPEVDVTVQQVSNAGGVQPVWARSGRELFYLQPGSPVRLMVVSVETDPVFRFENRQPLMDWPYFFPGPNGRTYDVSLDGDQFLAVKPYSTNDDAFQRPRLTIILNWFEELKERVPVDSK